MSEQGKYRFHISAFKPDTMPMYRLADYIIEISTLMGTKESLHLIGIDEGSTVPVIAIDIEDEPKVRQRLHDIRSGVAPKDALAAESKINKMLAEDNGTAWIETEQNSAQILVFPGAKGDEIADIIVDEYGTIEGEVQRVGGQKEDVPLLLKIDGLTISGCTSTKEIAKDLGKYLFEPVRLHGMGRWRRSINGWNLIKFHINSFQPLESQSLKETVSKLRGFRSVSDEQAAKAWKEIIELRNDQAELH